jgi:hypothetical protein
MLAQDAAEHPNRLILRLQFSILALEIVGSSCGRLVGVEITTVAFAQCQIVHPSTVSEKLEISSS